MPHKRAGDVVRVGAVEDGTVAQADHSTPAANTVVVVEHFEQNSLHLGSLEAAGGIGGKGHLGISPSREASASSSRSCRRHFNCSRHGHDRDLFRSYEHGQLLG